MLNLLPLQVEYLRSRWPWSSCEPTGEGKQFTIRGNPPKIAIDLHCFIPPKIGSHLMTPWFRYVSFVSTMDTFLGSLELHEVWVGNIMTPVNLRDSQWEAVLWLAVWFRLNLHQWSFSNMSGAVLWNSCFRGTRSFLKPGAIGILRVWSLRRSGDFQGEKSSWCYRSKYRHHTPTIVVPACSVSGEHAIDNFTKMLYQPAQCYIWFLSVSYLKDTFAGSQAPSSTPYQPLGTDGHMTWWDPTWNGMGHYGTPWPWPGAGWFDSGIWECQQSRDKHGFLVGIFRMGSDGAFQTISLVPWCTLDHADNPQLTW